MQNSTLLTFPFCSSGNVLARSHWEVIYGHTLALACGWRFEWQEFGSADAHNVQTVINKDEDPH